MKEIVFIATVFMEFNEESHCNAFYKNYKSSNGLLMGHTAKCSMITRYKDNRELSVGTFDHVTPPPLPRPAAIANMRAP